MPTYDYECKKCGNVAQAFHKMTEKVEVTCDCGGICKKVILSVPNVVIPPNMSATPDKFKYYGIVNPITGEEKKGCGEITDAPGIRVKKIDD